MAKVITFSRTFPKGHPKAGEPTYFVEQILNALGYDYHSGEYLSILNNLNDSNKIDLVGFFFSLGFFKDTTNEKSHTIRALSKDKKTAEKYARWKQGDKASLRVWSGMPYNSPQIIIAPDVELVEVYGITINNNGLFEIKKYKENLLFGYPTNAVDDIAKNDGLSTKDFLSWFKYPKKFDGQILCWKEVDYV